MPEFTSVNNLTATGAQSARQPEVATELEGLNKNIEELAAQISYLEDRLSPALSPVQLVGQETVSAAAPDSPMAPLAATLRDLKRRVAILGGQLAGIMDRIELPR